jgi:hypothetical protein
MTKPIIVAILSAALMTSCAFVTEVDSSELSPAGFWKKNIEENLSAGASVSEVQSYLEQGEKTLITLSADRRLLRAERRIEIKRLWPPIDLKSMRAECGFDADGGLTACAVFVSTSSCCER